MSGVTLLIAPDEIGDELLAFWLDNRYQLPLLSDLAVELVALFEYVRAELDHQVLLFHSSPSVFDCGESIAEAAR